MGSPVALAPQVEAYIPCRRPLDWNKATNSDDSAHDIHKVPLHVHKGPAWAMLIFIGTLLLSAHPTDMKSLSPIRAVSCVASATFPRLCNGIRAGASALPSDALQTREIAARSGES